jgi:hypothetical protein
MIKKLFKINLVSLILVSCVQNNACVDNSEELKKTEAELKEKTELNERLILDNSRLQNKIELLNQQSDDLMAQIDDCERSNKREVIVYNNNELNGIISSPSDGFANLRDSPNQNGFVIAELQESQKVSVIGKIGRWLKVRTNQGEIGYIHDTLVVIVS